MEKSSPSKLDKDDRSMKQRIASYSIAAGAVLGLSHRIDAAIVYFNPETLPLDNSNTSQTIDMDGDGTAEFEFSWSDSNVRIEKASGNGWFYTESSYPYALKRMAASNMVTTNLRWESSSRLVNGSGTGPFYYGGQSSTTGYIGVKFTTDGSTYLGWIKYQSNSFGATGEVLEWAYQDDAAIATIQAGKKLNTFYSAAWSDGTPNSRTADARIIGTIDVATHGTENNITVRDLDISGTSELSFTGTDATITVYGDIYNGAADKRISVTNGGSVVLHSPIVIGSPIPGNSGILSYDGATLSWTEATDDVSDQSALQYRVYTSGLNNLTSVEDIESAVAGGQATAGSAWEIDMDSYAVAVLQGSYLNVIVKDEAGNKAMYTPKLYPIQVDL